MTLDASTDVVLAAVATLLRDHVNGQLADELGEDAIRAVYQHPAPLRIVGALELPALSISRGTQRYSLGVDGIRTTIPLVISYVTPPTPLAKLGLRWPVLERVWREMLDALLAGESEHSTVDLSDVGAVDLDLRAATKTEQYADQGEGTVFPSFVANVGLLVDDVVDLSAFDPLVDIFATYSLVDPELPPLVAVEDLITFPGVEPTPTVETDGEWYGET